MAVAPPSVKIAAQETASAAIPVDAGTVDFRFDPAEHPDGAIVVLETYISEDDGVTWRYHGGATIDIEQAKRNGTLAGTGVGFARGNQNDRFRIKTASRIYHPVAGVPLQIAIDDPLTRPAGDGK